MEHVRRLSGAVLHAVGTVFSETPHFTDVSLTPAQADALIKYQRRLPHHMYLGERAFFVAEIVDMESSSVKIHKALIKHGMILEAPNTSNPASNSRHAAEDEMPVKTSAVTKNFPHQLASTGLSIRGQKFVVVLLFFWYEEWRRWCRLEREERNCKEQLENARRVNNTRGISFFSSELNKISRKKRLLWSEREENRGAVGNPDGAVGSSENQRGRPELDGVGELPSYRDSTTHGITVQVDTGGAARVSGRGGVDELPSYGELTTQQQVTDANQNEAQRAEYNDVAEEEQGSDTII